MVYAMHPPQNGNEEIRPLVLHEALSGALSIAPPWGFVPPSSPLDGAVRSEPTGSPTAARSDECQGLHAGQGVEIFPMLVNYGCDAQDFGPEISRPVAFRKGTLFTVTDH